MRICLILISTFTFLMWGCNSNENKPVTNDAQHEEAPGGAANRNRDIDRGHQGAGMGTQESSVTQ